MRGAPVAANSADPALFVWVLILICVAGVLGGASHDNPLVLAAIELTALPVVVLALRRRSIGHQWDAGVLILALIVLVPVLQVTPLPPAVWESLAGHQALTRALAALDLPLRWAPLSLFPSATLDCALALIAPAALFLATPLLARPQRRAAAVVWLGVGVAGLLLGVAQLAQPQGGPAYLYPITNVGFVVGLFANRNHEAGFLLALIPLAAALAAPERRQGGPDRRPSSAGSWAPIPAAAFAFVAVVALGVVQSRAGVILAVPAVLGALAVLQRSRVPRAGLALAASAALVGIAAVSLFAFTPLETRFASGLAGEARFEAWPTVIEAARAFQPLGAGLGAFERVYRAAEPLRLVGPTFFNHAHDEYLELWLETGVVGPALVAAFVVWFAMAARRAWARGGEPVARAASVAILMLMAQSGVDYPLRTQTLACLFAFACGCLAVAPAASGRP